MCYEYSRTHMSLFRKKVELTILALIIMIYNLETSIEMFRAETT
jgi:hypothetical protein